MAFPPTTLGLLLAVFSNQGSVEQLPDRDLCDCWSSQIQRRPGVAFGKLKIVSIPILMPMQEAQNPLYLFPIVHDLYNRKVAAISLLQIAASRPGIFRSKPFDSHANPVRAIVTPPFQEHTACQFSQRAPLAHARRSESRLRVCRCLPSRDGEGVVSKSIFSTLLEAIFGPARSSSRTIRGARRNPSM